MGETVPDLAANAILQAYLKVLEMEGNDHLVAAYAACLRQGSGEESYARFLRCKLTITRGLTQTEGIAMDPNATKESRREALMRARQHNLDVASIAKETVRMVLEQAFLVSQPYLLDSAGAELFQDIPALSRNQPDVASLVTGLNERDVYLIRAVEWLTFLTETADEALIKSNAVARYFLGELPISFACTKLIFSTGSSGRSSEPFQDITDKCAPCVRAGRCR
jgi:nuclear pore complex protein Nup107